MEREPRTHRQCDHKRWWNGGFETLGGQPLRKRRAVRKRRSGAPAMRLVLPPEKALHCYQCPFSPHNGRFLRHRPKRSERRLNYGNCTRAMARCQRAKVCRRPSAKTMLGDSESLFTPPFDCVRKLTGGMIGKVQFAKGIQLFANQFYLLG